MTARARVWIAFVAVVSFGGWASGCVIEIEHVSDGVACMGGDAGPAHEVVVQFQTCLSSTCDELEAAECTATLEGTTITIEASATVRSKSGRCTLDCVHPVTSCETPPLEPGTYTLVLGEDSVEVTVPMEMEVCTVETFRTDG